MDHPAQPVAGPHVVVGPGRRPHLLRTFRALALAVAGSWAWAQSPPPVEGWIGPAGSVSAEAIAAGGVPLKPIDLHQPQPLRTGLELWLRLERPASAEPLVLQVPTPIVDEVTLHQRVQGQWIAQAAGDHVAMSAWPVPGRYAVFPLQAAAAPELLVRVRHVTALALPLQVTPQSAQQQRALLEYLGFGIAFGAAALLFAACLRRAWVLRDRGYVLLAINSVLMVFAVAGITGVAAHLLWGDAGRWVDAAPGAIALAAAGTICFVSAHLTAAVARMPRLGWILGALGLVGFPLAAGYVAAPRVPALSALSGYIFAVAAASLVAATLTWRRGDAVGKWMLLGALPLTASVFVSLGRSLGWLEASWLTDYAVVIAFLLNLPMMFGALNSRSRERRSARLRQQASQLQDPLTGLPRSKVFYSRLLHGLRLHAQNREPATIGLVQIANLEAIKSAQGAEGAEESILRCVIMLREVLRDIDTAGRVGEGRFGLLLEGVGDRQRATEVATRLVAAGLRETPDGGPALRLHIALVVLPEYSPPVEQLVQELQGLLASMSPWTRRPIRFLTAQTPPMPAMPSDGLQESAQAA